MAMSKKPSLTPPKPTEEATPAAVVEPKPVPEGPEVDKIINRTSEAEARRKAKEAEEAAERELERKIMRRHLAWLQPGAHDGKEQTNVMLPKRLKQRIERVIQDRQGRTNISQVVTDLLDAWVREELEKLNYDYE